MAAGDSRHSSPHGAKMLDDLQKRTAQAIVNIFETGRLLGDYGAVTVLAGDSGHLTYGRSQTTLSSGNLHLLIDRHCAAAGAGFADALAAYLSRLEARDVALDRDGALHALLRAAGDDPVMRDAQDAFFDRVYWRPAEAHAGRIGAGSALGHAVIYDSVVHGSWPLIRDRVTDAMGPIGPTVDERTWIGRYVSMRSDWLGGHSNALLRRTAYRMAAFADLIGRDAWALPLPLWVRGVEISRDRLLTEAPLRASAAIAETRLLKLRQPHMQGEDVRAVQKAMRNAGAPLEADGVYGPATEAAVRAFQARKGLTPDGVVGNATRAALGID